MREARGEVNAAGFFVGSIAAQTEASEGAVFKSVLTKLLCCFGASQVLIGTITSPPICFISNNGRT
jgi:hypothetical protein